MIIRASPPCSALSRKHAQCVPTFSDSPARRVAQNPGILPTSVGLLQHQPSRQVQCNFQGPATAVQEGKRSFTDSESTRVGPVVVAFDNTEEGSQAVSWAVTNLLCPSEQADSLEVVHVVCDPRGMRDPTGVGRSPGGRQVTIPGPEFQAGLSSIEDYMERLLDQAYQAVVKRCGSTLNSCGVPHQVHLPRLPCPRSASIIGESLLMESRRLGARMLVVANHGPGAMAEYGSVARYLYQHADMPLVLIPSTNRQYFGMASFDAESAAAAAGAGAAGARTITPEEKHKREQVISHSLPATQSRTPPQMASRDEFIGLEQKSGAAASSEAQECGSNRGYREVMLVVTHLPELEEHWQWVADNLCRHGDVLNIWHMCMLDGPPPQVLPEGMANLPIALRQVLSSRGLGDIKYSQHYPESLQEAAKQVVGAADSESGPRMVCLLNYSRKGLIREAVQGSLASELTRHCPVPLVLLQPAA